MEKKMHLVIFGITLGTYVTIALILFVFLIGLWVRGHYSHLFNMKSKEIDAFKLTIYRFFLHLLTMIPIAIALILLYFIINVLFSYGSSIMPELIGAAISVIVIDFLIKERELKEKQSINVLLNNKISRISETIDEVLKKFIDFENFDKKNINKELLVNILEKQELDIPLIDYQYLESDGSYKKEKISKFDYIYFIGKDLLPVVDNLITKYSRYINNDILCDLISLEDILSERLVKFRISSMGTIDKDIYDRIVDVIIEYLIIMNALSIKLDPEGDNKNEVK
jgi:hypothetical protein